MADKQFYLPIEIIQHVQIFLNRKEATRTIILSKTWFTAWSTRPVLYFDEADFPDSDEFQVFCRKTIQRFKQLNVRVDKFILRNKVSNTRSTADLVNELIVDALNMGSGNALEVEINTTQSSLSRPPKYVLPAQLFATRSLTRLYTCGVRINELKGRILSSRLKSLCLVQCDLTNDTVRDILMGCPLIEEFDLQDCFSLSNKKIGKLIVSDDNHVCCEIKDVKTELDVTNVPRFCYLRRLHLKDISVNKDFFTEFSSRFPCIEDLTLVSISASACRVIRISSHSLRYLTLSRLCSWVNKLQCDVPNISRFVYKQDTGCIPLLSFSTASREWESEVEFTQSNSVLWFVGLRNFLIELRRSRISLSINSHGEFLDSANGMITCFPIPPEVENLKIFSHSSSDVVHDLLITLFRICRPKFIAIFKSIWHSDDYHVLQVLYELLIQNKNKEMPHVYNLEKVHTEFFEENIMEWFPFGEQTNAFAFPQGHKQIRFRLNWARKRID